MKKLALIPLILLGLGLAQPTFADKDKGYCPKKMQKMTKELNLSKEQQDKIKDIKQTAYDKLKSQKSKMSSVYKQMKSAAFSEKMDESQVDALVKEKKDLMGEMLKTKLMMKNDVYNVLNDKQKAKFKQMMDKKYKKMHKHHKDQCPDDDNDDD